MYAIAVDANDTPEMLEEWVDRHDPAWALISGADVDAVNRVIEAELLDANRVPATIVTDREGRVLLARWGPPSVSELRTLLWRQGSMSLC